MATTAPYGTWKSPIVADLITQKTIGIAEVHVDPITKTIYHAESRPSGKTVVVNTLTGEDVFEDGWNARSGVHEYGGAAFAVRNGVVLFTDYGTKRLFRAAGKHGTSEPVSPDNSNHCFGDFEIHPIHTHLVVSILEDHTQPKPSDVITSLVIINTQTQAVTTIAHGADFYSTPRFNTTGDKISWIQWYHPDMPWEGSELVVATVDLSSADKPLVTDPTIISGKRGEESINQANWISEDTIIYLTDKSGFYNPWRYVVGSGVNVAILPEPMKEEYAEPAWMLGASRWAALNSETLLVSPSANGVVYLALLHVNTGKLTKINSPYVKIDAVTHVEGIQFVFVGSTDALPSTLVLMTPSSTTPNLDSITATFKPLKETSTVAATVPAGIFPKHQAITFSIEPHNAPLHILYFPPTNPEYSGGANNELPPCVLNSHGGPTGRVIPGLSWVTTYFTSRGWAWVDVNYGGSSGYGREYRDRLRGQWGIVDVEDCVTAADKLGERGLIDRKRVAIRGGSAGGYTVLAALVNKPTSFAVGSSLYGISDLAMLAGDTHKFESRYLEGLIGGTIEQIPEVYKERSPVFHADKISVPLLILQGSIDRVVPPGQAEAIVREIKKHNGKVEYVVFEGEGHGWRKAENIKAALEKELAFYLEVFSLN